MNKGFNLPLVIDIPVEKQGEIEKRYKEDVTYAILRERKIIRNWRNLKSNLRVIGDYIYQHFREELSYKQISKDLGIKEGCIRVSIGDLNFWREYPIRIIPIPKRKGFIQSSLKNPRDTEKYLKRKSRTITSMEQVYDNVDVSIRMKQRKKRKVKVKNKAK